MNCYLLEIPLGWFDEQPDGVLADMVIWTIRQDWPKGWRFKCLSDDRSHYPVCPDKEAARAFVDKWIGAAEYGWAE